MNSLVVHTGELQVLQTIARTAHASGLYNTVGGEAKILMILLAAQDLGIKPTIALNGGIWNIQGKIEISARLMTSMIRRAGHSISIKECNDKICTLKGKRADNADEIESSFSIEDAQKAGLASRDVWKKYAEDMLYARAMSRLARRLFPDVIGNAYVEGEIRDEQQTKPEQMVPSAVEVSDCLPVESPQVEKTEPVLIDFTQLDNLIALKKRCDPDYIQKVEERLTQKGIAGYEKLPLNMFELLIAGMTANARKFEKQG